MTDIAVVTLSGLVLFVGYALGREFGERIGYDQGYKEGVADLEQMVTSGIRALGRQNSELAPEEDRIDDAVRRLIGDEGNDD